MVVISLVACLGASILLVVIGGFSVIGVYSGTCERFQIHLTNH